MQSGLSYHKCLDQSISTNRAACLVFINTMLWYYARGRSGGAKVLCILCHRGVQLILAYSWARPAILVAGKGRGGMFLFLLFLHFHSCSSIFLFLSFISSTVSSITLLPFSGRRHKMTHKGWRVVKPQHNKQWYYAKSVDRDQMPHSFRTNMVRSKVSIYLPYLT